MENKQNEVITQELAETKLSTQLVDADKVEKLKNEIVVTDGQSVNKFGSQQQNQLSQFSDNMLKEVQNKDVTSVGKTLDSLLKTLKESDPDSLLPDNAPFYKKWFKQGKKEIQKAFNQLQSVSSRVDKISYELDNNQKMLNRDIELLDGLFHENQQYAKDLNNFIEAGEQRKYEIETHELKDAREKAKQTGDQIDIQKVADIEQYISRLDKRIYDLRVSRDVALQSAPQIRMIQNVNQALVEKIQSSVMTSIPLWKNQMAIALSLGRQQQMTDTMKRVSDTTNDLILRNSEMLKDNATKTARETERSVVEIETLKQTQANIIEMIDETMRISEEGRKEREQSKEELAKLEGQINQQQLGSGE